MVEPAETAILDAETEPRKTGVPLRILAVILALVLALVCGAIIAGASDNVSVPTCRDVNAGKAAVPSSGDCFNGSTVRADTGLALACAAGVMGALALVLSFVLAATGRRGRHFLLLVGAAIALLGLALLAIHI